jgi:hypothetical protein
MGKPIPVTTLQYDLPVGAPNRNASLLQVLLQRGQTDPSYEPLLQSERRRREEQEAAEAFVRQAMVAQQMRAMGAELASQPVVESPLYQQLMKYRGR